MKALKLALLPLLLCGIAFAKNPCNTLKFEISNDTTAECRLMGQEVLAGDFLGDFHLPRILPKNYHLKFDMEDKRLQGPKLKLTYVCKKQSITFTTKQGYCKPAWIWPWAYGSISMETDALNEDKDIYLSPYKHEGSRWDARAGRVTWVIHEGHH